MGETLAINVDLYRAQDDFVHSGARLAAFIGGIGSGKSYAGAVRALIVALRTKSLGMIVAPSYPMLRDATLRTFNSIASGAIVDFNRGEMRATLLNGSEILFRSADNPDSLRGSNLAWLWIDEARDVKEDAWLVLLGRMREGEAQVWITTTPRGKQHWTYKVFGLGGGELHHARTQDNRWLPASYVASVEQAYIGAYARQELGGEFTDAEGALFKREWFNVIDTAPDGLTWVRAWDLAISKRDSADRTASVRVSADSFGNVYIADGIAGRWEWNEAREIIVSTAMTERHRIVVERVAFQLAAVQELQADPRLIGVGIVPDLPHSEGTGESVKVERARVWQARAASGKVILIRGAWVSDWLDEVTAFTADMTHRHDDYVDATSAAVRHLGTLPRTIQSIHARPQPSVFNRVLRGNESVYR